jgi:hypothetical protein
MTPLLNLFEVLNGEVEILIPMIDHFLSKLTENKSNHGFTRRAY